MGVSKDPRGGGISLIKLHAGTDRGGTRFIASSKSGNGVVKEKEKKTFEEEEERLPSSSLFGKLNQPIDMT